MLTYLFSIIYGIISFSFLPELATNSQTLERISFNSFPLSSRLQMLLDFLSMRLDDLDYHLPPRQIAQRPLDRRDSSRLLLLSRSEGSMEDRLFVDLPD